MKAPKLFYDNTVRNIIPRDGEAIYHGPIFDWEISNKYLEKLLRDIPFRSEERVMYDKYIVTKRKIAWYGQEKLKARKWPAILVEIKNKVEEVVKVKYDSCLLNLYIDGTCGLGWHNDEESISEDSSIASVSFGEERRFDLRYIKNKKEVYSVVLEHGALLIMQGIMQKYWEHHLPKSKRIVGPRINITFRKKTQKKTKNSFYQN